MYWELSILGAGASNYEVWTNEPSWSAIQSGSLNEDESPFICDKFLPNENLSRDLIMQWNTQRECRVMAQFASRPFLTTYRDHDKSLWRKIYTRACLHRDNTI